MKFLFLAKILLLRKLERNRQEKQPITHNQTIITSELTMYSHTGQYDHILSQKQVQQVTHSLYSEDFTPNISLWLEFKHSNL